MNVGNHVKKNLLIILKSSGHNNLKITSKSSLKYDLDLSSIDIMAFISSLEKDFNLEIDMNLVKNIKTVGDVIKFIRGHIYEK